MKQSNWRRAFLFAAMCLPALALAGTIRGKVVLDGPAPAAQKVAVTIDQYLCGNEKDAQDLTVSPRGEIADAVVWLENPPAGAAWPAVADKVAIDQKRCEFVPRVVIVPAGGTVEFLNSDRLLHNIHAMPKENVSFNRTQPKDRAIPVTFEKPEVVRVDCDLHSWMRAWVVVAAHPYYARTGADGRFVFDRVPAGSYRLVTWQERLGTTTTQVTVPASGDASVNVALKPR